MLGQFKVGQVNSQVRSGQDISSQIINSFHANNVFLFLTPIDYPIILLDESDSDQNCFTFKLIGQNELGIWSLTLVLAKLVYLAVNYW